MAGLANGFSERLQAQSNTLLNVSDTFTNPLIYNVSAMCSLGIKSTALSNYKNVN